MAAMARLFVDISPLRGSRDFRWLFAGHAVSRVGTQVTMVAAPIQVFDLTGSTLAVGLLGLVQFPALFVGSLLGGLLADSRDRRRILIITQLVFASTSAGLAVNAAAASPSTVRVFVLTAVHAFMAGIDSPARSAAIPRLVDPKILPHAFALNVLVFQTAGAVGPAFAGILISRASLAAAYWVDVATFGVALGAVILMSPIPPPGDGMSPGLRSIAEGFRFIGSKQELQGVFLIDINAMIFGMPRALFPQMGLEVFGGDASTVGYLFAAPGFGAMLASLTSGWVGRIAKPGRATIAAVFLWGVGVMGFGFTSNIWLALALLALAGAGDAISAVFRQTILQLSTPDRLRGRLSAAQIAVVAGGPRLGDAEAGVVAAGFGPSVAAWTGGLAAALGALVVGRYLPRFREWDHSQADEGNRHKAGG
jgi:MFS family permease